MGKLKIKLFYFFVEEKKAPKYGILIKQKNI